MTPKQSCPHCGANISSRWERLSPGLVECLIKAIQAVHREKQNRFHWHKDLTLSNNESHNLQKLRYHALIAHYDEENPKSGEWLITARGGAFLRGETSVPKAVLVFRNKVMDHAKELVHIDEFRGKVSAFQKEFAYEAPQVRLKKVAQPLFKAA